MSNENSAEEGAVVKPERAHEGNAEVGKPLPERTAPSRLQPPETVNVDGENSPSQPDHETPSPEFNDLHPDKRKEFEEQGITSDVYDELKALSQELIENGSLPPEKQERLEDMVDKLQVLSPDIKQKLGEMLTAENQKLSEELDKPDPAAALEVDPQTVSALGEAQGAVNHLLASDDRELDIDRAKAASDALHKAREKLDLEKADKLGEGPSKAYRIWVTLGIMFYLYVGAQYAMAKFVGGFSSNK